MFFEFNFSLKSNRINKINCKFIPRKIYVYNFFLIMLSIEFKKCVQTNNPKTHNAKTTDLLVAVF